MQRKNQLTLAIRAAAVAGALGVAGQASAFDISVGDVKASVYGYARLTASYDINEKITSDDSTLAGDFSMIDNSENEGHFDASATQSRIGIRTALPTGVNVTVEGDFASSGNFRLRHAFGEYNGFLAGQTWSNYNSFVGNTPTLDFNGAAGLAGYQARAAQLRYTTGGLSVSVEDPKGSLTGTNDEKDSMPAFTARYEGSADALSYAAAALVKQNAYDDGAEDDSAMGYAVFAAAKFKLNDMISIQGNLNYTDGANGYLYQSGGSDAQVDTDGSLDTISGYGGTIGTSVALGNGRSINLVYGMTNLDVDNDTDEETRSNILANYMWTPVKNVMLGVEYGYWQTETKGGDSEDANRILFAAQYNF